MTATSSAAKLAANKQTVTDFWRAFSESRFEDALARLADDASWWVSGTTSLSGTYSKRAFSELVAGVTENTEQGVQIEPGHLTAEEDRVAMEATSHGLVKNGKTYRNRYHFLHVLRDGEIVEVREYMDTEHVTEVFGNG